MTQVRVTEIEPLSNNMHLFESVAEMKYQEFSYLTEQEKLADYLNRQKQYVTDQVLPKAYIALHQGQLIGTFTLKLEDLSTRTDLSPWIGGMVVSPKYRRQGIGAFIVSQAEHFFMQLGYSQIYLFTPDKEGWYSKMGWRVLERTFLHQFPITVMSKQL